MKPFNIKFKITALILVAFAASPALAATKNTKVTKTTKIEKELALKPYIVAEGENITVGDIFYNAGSKSNIVIARAATNREKLIYNANSLQNRLSSFGLKWNNKEGISQVTILGKNSNYDNTDNLRSRNLEIAQNYYHLNQGPSYYTGNPQNAEISYNNQQNNQIAVLNRNVEKGDIIDSSMIAWIDPPKGARFGFLKDAENIIGRTATQNIDAMQPIKNYQLILPMAIKKGDNVTVISQMEGLTISMTGKAMSDGAIGSSVKIANSSSNKIIDAIVKSQGVAEITLPQNPPS